MSWMTLCLLTIGTSVDAFAVSLARSSGQSPIRRHATALSALCFGLSASLATALGAYLVPLSGSEPPEVAERLGALLIAVIGLRCVRSGLRQKTQLKSVAMINNTTMGSIICAAFASSYDCLAVGGGIRPDESQLAIILLAIGIGSGLASLIGCVLGRRCLRWGEGNAECLGGFSLCLFAVSSWTG